jgi:hypothetical protein
LIAFLSEPNNEDIESQFFPWLGEPASRPGTSLIPLSCASISALRCSMPVEVQQRRERALRKGPEEFRDVREDLPKPPSVADSFFRPRLGAADSGEHRQTIRFAVTYKSSWQLRGAKQCLVAVPEIAAANVALAKVADASLAATPQKNVDVIVLETGLAVRG